jgi:pimeloyl-ACP methyl ester carboxylesterase
MALDDSNAEALKAYLGQDAYNEYREIAGRLDWSHLGIQSPKNLIFVPGVMGSMLQSKTKGGIWWVDIRTRKHVDDLRLAPNGEGDADPTNQIVPITTDPTYEPFLTAVLARDDFGHELFPYDRRKPLHLSTGALRDLVLKLYSENGKQPVHLVAHSMGGLMVRATLMDYGQELWPKIGQIVFIGTPHYGSPAIAGYLKNHLWGFELMAVLGLFLSRETYRSLWGVLSMLPAPKGMYPGTRPNDPAPWQSENAEDPYVHPCANFDMYQASLQKAQLQNVLSGAAEFHRNMYEAHQALDQNLRDRMLVIAGVGFQTLFRLAYEPRFFGLWERMAKVKGRIAGEPHREGDGRAPLASAALENVHIRYVKGVHGGLPNIPAVYNDVFRWLKEEPMKLPDNVPEALSEHLAPGEGESETPNLDGTVRKIAFTDDPGLWNLSSPDPAHLDTMMAKLEAEQLPEFTRVRLL